MRAADMTIVKAYRDLESVIASVDFSERDRSMREWFNRWVSEVEVGQSVTKLEARLVADPESLKQHMREKCTRMIGAELLDKGRVSILTKETQTEFKHVYTVVVLGDRDAR